MEEKSRKEMGKTLVSVGVMAVMIIAIAAFLNILAPRTTIRVSDEVFEATKQSLETVISDEGLDRELRKESVKALHVLIKKYSRAEISPDGTRHLRVQRRYTQTFYMATLISLGKTAREHSNKQLPIL